METRSISSSSLLKTLIKDHADKELVSLMLDLVRQINMEAYDRGAEFKARRNLGVNLALSPKRIYDVVSYMRRSATMPRVVTSEDMAARMNEADRRRGLEGGWHEGDYFYWGVYVWE